MNFEHRKRVAKQLQVLLSLPEKINPNSIAVSGDVFGFIVFLPTNE